MNKVGILTIHGMGASKSGNHEHKVNKIRKKLSEETSSFTFDEPILYFEEIQKAQDELIERYGDIGLPGSRRIMISAFSDALTIVKNPTNYNYVMRKIKNAFNVLSGRMGNEGKIIIVASSLGCEMISNYIWDEMKQGSDLSYVKCLITHGCNIPLFRTGLDPNSIIAIKKPCPEFEWINFWTKKDPLGYGLQPLSPSYNSLVKDIRLKWSIPYLSHTRYFRRAKVVKLIAKKVEILSKG